MQRRGYNMWSVDEFAKFMKGPVSGNPDRWKDYYALAQGLSKYDKKGVIFNAVVRHDAQNDMARTVKIRWKMLLSETQNYHWDELSDYTKLWADEAYTRCSEVCTTDKLGKKAAKTNAYMQKLARLAFAPDAPTDDPTTVGPARAFLQTQFAPLINGWGAVNREKAHGTYDMCKKAPKKCSAQINRLASLQVYAARAWIRSEHPYADRRIGVRWTDLLQLDNNWKGTQRRALARRIARALRGAYSPGGRAIEACDPTGGTSSKLCQVTVDGAQFNSLWEPFRFWGQSSTSPPDDSTANPVAQVVADGNDYVARPSNGCAVPGDSSRWRGYWEGRPAVFSDYQWQLCGYATDHSFGTTSNPLTGKVCSSVSAGDRPVLGISGQVEQAWRGYGAANGPRAVFSALADEIPDGLNLGQASWDEESIIDPYPNGTFDRWYSRECHAAVGIESLEPAECGDYWFHEIDPNIPGWGREVDESETTDGEPWHVVGGFYYDYNGLKPWLEVDFTATTAGGSEPVHQVAYSPGCSNFESFEFLTMSDGSQGVCEFEN